MKIFVGQQIILHDNPGIEKKQIFQHFLASILAVSMNEFSSIQEIINRSNSLCENKVQLNNRLTTALKTKEQEVSTLYITIIDVTLYIKVRQVYKASLFNIGVNNLNSRHKVVNILKKTTFYFITHHFYSTQGISLEKIKEAKLKKMLELNASLLTLQEESDKFLSKIQMNKARMTQKR